MGKESRPVKKISYKGNDYTCSLAFTLQLIGDKYKSLILFHLRDGAMRSGELQKSISDLSNRMFTHTIRRLENDTLVKRTVFLVSPPQVEYEPTQHFAQR